MKYLSHSLTLITCLCAIACSQTDEVHSYLPDSRDVGTVVVASTAICPAGYKIIQGTDGDDVISGTDGNDCIFGLGGNDIIHGNKGNDILIGGPGDDTLVGGKGDDTIFGDEGNDKLVGGKGHDIIDGGNGHDLIDGVMGQNTLSGNMGNDVIIGGKDKDTIFGGPGNDVIFDDSGKNTVDGGMGTDNCNGTRCENQQVKPAPTCASDDDCEGTELCALPIGICVSCQTDGECSEDGGCSEGSCQPALGCQYTPVANGTSCTDGDSCNGEETCHEGVCEPGVPVTPEEYAADQDGDLHGDPDTVILLCGPPPAGLVAGSDLITVAGDCNDGNSSVYPGAPEIPNDGIDQDCDGSDAVTTAGFTQIDVGEEHVCGVQYDGSLKCWGRDDSGSVEGPNGDSGTDYLQVSAGGSEHTCALRQGGIIKCFGNEYYNDPVNGPNSDTEMNFVQVVTSAWYTCGLRSDGSATCWGDDSPYHGQPMSIGTDTPSYVETPVFSTEGPFVQIAAGYSYFCGLHSDGGITCWGYNVQNDVLPPNPTGNPNFVQVATGGDGYQTQTCALRSNGSTVCWGTDAYGQVSGPNSDPEMNFAHISTGAYHTCGLRQNGSIVCWGWDGYGQVSGPNSVGGSDFVQISAGGHTTCAIRGDGSETCWGARAPGQHSLDNLTIEEGALFPSFDPSVREYSLETPLDYSQAAIHFLATSSHSCDVVINGEYNVETNVTSPGFYVDTGANQFEILVLCEHAAPESYTVTVNRSYKMLQQTSIPVLMLLVDFNDTNLATKYDSTETAEQSWSELMFGNSQAEGNHYWSEVSRNSFSTIPAVDTCGSPNFPGVVHVRLPYNKPTDGPYRVEDQDWIPDALDMASACMDFPSYDVNGDGSLENEELSVLTVLNLTWLELDGAGAEANIDLNYSVGGVVLKKFARTLDDYTSIGVNVHELGHHMFGLDHLLAPSGYSLMGTGSYNRDEVITAFSSPTDRSGTRPAHPTGYAKSLAGFVDPVMLTGTTYGVRLYKQTLNNYNVVKLETLLDSEIYLENRQPDGYDSAVPFHNSTGGIFGQEIYLTESAIRCVFEPEDYDFADFQSFAGHNDTFKRGGYTFTNVSAASDVMTLDIIKDDVTPTMETYYYNYWVPDGPGYARREHTLTAPGDSTTIIDFQSLETTRQFLSLEGLYNTGDTRHLVDAKWTTPSQSYLVLTHSYMNVKDGKATALVVRFSFNEDGEKQCSGNMCYADIRIDNGDQMFNLRLTNLP